MQQEAFIRLSAHGRSRIRYLEKALIKRQAFDIQWVNTPLAFHIGDNFQRKRANDVRRIAFQRQVGIIGHTIG